MIYVKSKTSTDECIFNQCKGGSRNFHRGGDFNIPKIFDKQKKKKKKKKKTKKEGVFIILHQYEKIYGCASNGFSRQQFASPCPNQVLFFFLGGEGGGALNTQTKFDMVILALSHVLVMGGGFWGPASCIFRQDKHENALLLKTGVLTT